MLSSVFFVSSANASEHVHGYTKRDGTYVQGYQRTNPNNTQSDNWSSEGNLNPYTGKFGTKQPKD